MDDKISRSPFTRGVIAAISLCYAISAGILYSQVGLWESVRQVLVNGTIVVLWLWSASIILRHTPIHESVPIRYPKFELGWLLTGLLLAVGWAANLYGGWLPLPRWLFYLSTFGTVLILFVGLRYPLRSLGLIWPPKRAWLVLVVTILINIGAAVLFQILPPGEKETLPQADLANQITGPLSVLVLVGGLLIRAALPEELLFRVGIQPRLAEFMPIGWAIFIQALLFNASHLPQHLLLYNESLLLSLGSLLIINNGLIGGYLYYRTQSLPLLLLLHLFAYPRFGI